MTATAIPLPPIRACGLPPALFYPYLNYYTVRVIGAAAHSLERASLQKWHYTTVELVPSPDSFVTNHSSRG